MVYVPTCKDDLCEWAIQPTYVQIHVDGEI